MDTSTKILLGGLAAVGVVLFVAEKRARAAALPAAPAPAATPTPIPFSQNPVSRSELPPSDATVPPGQLFATFSEGLTTSVSDIPLGTNIQGDQMISAGTLLAAVRLGDNIKQTTAAYPVVWVSPDGQRIGVMNGKTADRGIPPFFTFIAHKP